MSNAAYDPEKFTGPEPPDFTVPGDDLGSGASAANRPPSMGAGGACGKHGVYEGYVCSKCDDEAEAVHERSENTEGCSAATEPDFVAEHAREGIEWLRKLSTMQSRSDLTEKFDRMARAVEALLMAWEGESDG